MFGGPGRGRSEGAQSPAASTSATTIPEFGRLLVHSCSRCPPTECGTSAGREAPAATGMIESVRDPASWRAWMDTSSGVNKFSATKRQGRPASAPGSRCGLCAREASPSSSPRARRGGSSRRGGQRGGAVASPRFQPGSSSRLPLRRRKSSPSARRVGLICGRSSRNLLCGGTPQRAALAARRKACSRHGLHRRADKARHMWYVGMASQGAFVIPRRRLDPSSHAQQHGRGPRRHCQRARKAGLDPARSQVHRDHARKRQPTTPGVQNTAAHLQPARVMSKEDGMRRAGATPGSARKRGLDMSMGRPDAGDRR